MPHGPFPQDPTACPASSPPPPPFRPEERTGLALPSHRPNNQMSTDELPPRDTRPGHGSGHAPAKGDAPGAP